MAHARPIDGEAIMAGGTAEVGRHVQRRVLADVDADFDATQQREPVADQGSKREEHAVVHAGGLRHFVDGLFADRLGIGEAAILRSDFGIGQSEEVDYGFYALQRLTGHKCLG